MPRADAGGFGCGLCVFAPFPRVAAWRRWCTSTSRARCGTVGVWILVGAPRRRPDSSCCRHPPPTPPALMRDHGRRRPYPLTTTATQAAAAQTPRPHLPLPPPHARARVPAPRPPWTDVAPPPQPVGTRSPRAYVPAYRTAGAARGAIDEPPTEAPPVGWLQRSPRGVWVGCVPGPACSTCPMGWRATAPPEGGRVGSPAGR